MELMKDNSGPLAYRNMGEKDRKLFQNKMLDEMEQAVKVYYQSGIQTHRLQELARYGNEIEQADIQLKTVMKNELESEEISKDRLLEIVLGMMEERVYLEQLCRLLRQYRVEHKKREEYARFDAYVTAYKQLPQITKVIAHEGEMPIVQVQDQVPVRKNYMQKVLDAQPFLFRLREKDKQTLVSLTVTGKRFQEYTAAPRSIDTVQSRKISYQNCMEIIGVVNSALEGQKTVPKVLKLHGLSIGEENAIKQNYAIVLKKIQTNKAKAAMVFEDKAVVRIAPRPEPFDMPYEMNGDKNEKIRIKTQERNWG